MGFLGRWSLDKSDKVNVEMKDHESNDVEEKLEPDQDDIKEKEQSVPVMNKFNLNWHSGIKLSRMLDSVVIQSLFYLPAFRTMVLNFTSSQHLPMSDKERKIREFMSELRKLFVLLLSSQRKYVDPSKAVGILRGSLEGGEGGQGTSNQQDVRKLTHKLLDWH